MVTIPKLELVVSPCSICGDESPLKTRTIVTMPRDRDDAVLCEDCDSPRNVRLLERYQPKMHQRVAVFEPEPFWVDWARMLAAWDYSRIRSFERKHVFLDAVDGGHRLVYDPERTAILVTYDHDSGDEA